MNAMDLTLLIKPVSGRCDMHCKYCFYREETALREGYKAEKMTEATLENTIRKAIACSERSVSFTFQGGEPTLAGIEFFKNAVKLQQRYNGKHIKIYNSIQTNGQSLNNEWAEMLAENNFLLGVSIDGTRELHDGLRGKGTYDRAVSSAKLLEGAGVAFNVLCVVTKNVAETAAEVYGNLKKYKYLQFIPCLDGLEGEKRAWSLSPEAYGRFLCETFKMYESDMRTGKYTSVRYYDNYIGMLKGMPPESCELSGVCGSYLVIESDGSCYPCDFYSLDSYLLGNINSDSIIKMQKNENALRFAREGAEIVSECRVCKWFALCRGGCRRNREPFSEGLPRKNLYCESYKMFYESTIESARCLARLVR